MKKPRYNSVASWTLQSGSNGLQFSLDGQLLRVHGGTDIYTFGVQDCELHHRYAIDSSECGHCYFFRGGDSIMLVGSNHESEEGIHHIAVRTLKDYALKATTDVRVEKYGLMTLLFNHAEDRFMICDCGGTCHFFEFPSCARLQSVMMGTPRNMIYSPDESEVWTAGGEDEPDGYRGYVYAWDPTTGTLLKRGRPAVAQFYYGLRLTLDARLLVVVHEKSLSVLDPCSWDLVGTIEIPTAWGMCQPVLAFSPDGRYLALACDSNVGIFIVDLEELQVIETLKWDQPSEMRHLAYSPNGEFLASSTWDREVRLWALSR